VGRHSECVSKAEDGIAVALRDVRAIGGRGERENAGERR
jgi:hypothetical protein